MKKVLVLMLALVLALSCFTAMAEMKDEYNIGVLVWKFDDAYGSTVRQGMEKWAEIVKIIDEEIPTAAEIEKILVTIGIEPTISQLDLTSEDAKLTFQATKDIRDKYVLSRLAWDLGVMDELCALL